MWIEERMWMGGGGRREEVEGRERWKGGRGRREGEVEGRGGREGGKGGGVRRCYYLIEITHRV